MTEAQAALTADSAYGDLATSLTERQEGLSGQRDEAAGLALLEAAARIAGSKSPFLGQAIGEAAPAIGTYGKSLSEVRRQENALFDAQAKLTQLEMAEKAGRKDEVRKLRTELRDLDSVRRDIEDKAFTRFKTGQQLDLQVLGAQQKFATAKTAEERDKTRLQLAQAKDRRESFDLKNQLGETQANISDLKNAISNGKTLDGTPYTLAEKNMMQFQLDDLEAKKDEITKVIKETKSLDLADKLRQQSLESKKIAQIKSLSGQLTELNKEIKDKDIFMARYMGSDQSPQKLEEAKKAYQGKLELRASLQKRLGAFVPSSAANGAAQNVNFKVK